MLGTSERARFTVGYLILSGLKSVANRLLNLKELRLLIGNTTNREKVIGLVESPMKKAESLKSTGNRQRRR
jgi:hypothetical protein